MKLFLGYLFIALSLSLAGQVYGLDIYWQQEKQRQIAQKEAIQTAIVKKYSRTVSSTASPTFNTKSTLTFSPTVSATATPTETGKRPTATPIKG